MPYVPRPKQEGVIKGETRCFPLEIASRLCRGNRASAGARAILRGSSRLKPADEAFAIVPRIAPAVIYRL